MINHKILNNALLFTLLSHFQTALVSPTAEQFDELIQRLAVRLDNGHGEVIYNIGTGGNIFYFKICIL